MSTGGHGRAIERDPTGEIETAAGIIVQLETEEQGAVTGEINRNLLAIKDLSGQSVHGVAQTAEAPTEQARLASGLQGIATRHTI